MLVEVEGRFPLAKIDTIAKYFASAQQELASISLGILLHYAYEPYGRKDSRCYPKAASEPIIEGLRQVTLKHPMHHFICIGLDKACNEITSGIRSTSYYSGTASHVTGTLFAQGCVVDRFERVL